MKYNQISEFYSCIAKDPKINKILTEKAKLIKSRAGMENFIRSEILPIIKKRGIKLTEKDLIDYEETQINKLAMAKDSLGNVRELSIEDLEDVSGGAGIKSILMSGGLIATVLLGTIIPPGQSAYAALSKNQTVEITKNLKDLINTPNDGAQNNVAQNSVGVAQPASNDSSDVMAKVKKLDLKNVDKDYFLNALDLTTAQIWHISGVDERLRFFNGDINQVYTIGANGAVPKRDFAQDSGNASAKVMTCLFPSSGGILNTAGGSGQSNNLDKDCKPTPRLIAGIIGYIYNNVRIGKPGTEAKLADRLEAISTVGKKLKNVSKDFEKVCEEIKDKKSANEILQTILTYLNTLKSNKLIPKAANHDVYDKLEFLSTLIKIKECKSETQSKKTQQGKNRKKKEDKSNQEIDIKQNNLIYAAANKCKNNDNIKNYITQKQVDKKIIEELQLGENAEQSKPYFEKNKELMKKVIPFFEEEFTYYPSGLIDSGELESKIKRDIKENALRPEVDKVNSFFKEQLYFDEDIISENGDVNETEFSKYFGKIEDKGRALRCVEYLLNNIAGMVKAEGNGVFPKYTTEKVLLDFCICYFDKQEDLYNTMEEIFPKIKLKAGSPGISNDDYLKGWEKIDKRIKLLEKINKNQLIPYNAPLESNKNALEVKRDVNNSLAFSTTRFADCADVAILHIMNLLSYGGEKYILFPKEEDSTEAEREELKTDETAIINAISNPESSLPSNITPQRIIKAFFHYIYSGKRFDDSSIIVRSFWNLIVSNMDSLKAEDGYYSDVKYCRNNGNELETGYVNMLKVIYNIIYCLKGKDQSNEIYNKKIQYAKQAIDDLVEILKSNTKSDELTNKLKDAIEKTFGLVLSQGERISIESDNNLNINRVQGSNDLFGKISITLEKGNTRDDNNELKFTIDHSEKHSEVNCNVLEPIVLDDSRKDDEKLLDFIHKDETAQLLSRFFTTKSLLKQANEEEQELLNDIIQTNSIFNNLFGNIRLNESTERPKEYKSYIANTKALKFLDAIEKGYEQGELAESINENKEFLYSEESLWSNGSNVEFNIEPNDKQKKSKLKQLNFSDFITQNYLSRVAGEKGGSNCGVIIKEFGNNQENEIVKDGNNQKNKIAFVYKVEGDQTVKLFAMAPLYKANKDLDIEIPQTIEIESKEYDVRGVEITNGAFSQCKELKTITFPNGILELTIGNGAFQGCEKLTEFKVPASVTNLTIGNNAFSSYIAGRVNIKSGLSKFEFADKAQIDVLNIGDSAFLGCEHLEEPNVPASVTNLTIGSNAFSSYIAGGGVTIKSGFKKFKFADDAKIKELNIGDGAFWACENLGEFNVPDSVIKLSIGKEAFKYSRLNKFTNKSRIKELNVGDGAFSSCKELESFNVPGSVTKLTIGKEAFSAWVGKDGIVIQESKLKKFVIPTESQIGELNIGDSAFDGCEHLEGLNVPTSVIKLTIGKEAFSRSGLNRFEFPVGSQIDELYVGDAAFQYCGKLKGFNVPYTVTKLAIGANAFKDSGLNKFEIPKEAKIAKLDMVQGSFWGCESLDPEEGSGLDVPDNVKTQADKVAAFDEPEDELEDKLENKDQTTTSSDVQSILLTENFGEDPKNKISFAYTIEFAYEVKENGTVKLSVKEVRYRHNRRFDIKIPQTITIGNDKYDVSEVEITSGAFRQCRKLKKITFPKNITELNIPENAFAACESLKEFNVPDTVTRLTIGKNAFENCTKFKEFKVPTRVTNLTIEEAFSRSGLNKFEVPAGAQITELNIGESAFQGCKDLTEFKVPDHAKKLNIGSGAFKGSGLKKFEISDKAEITELNIGESAFQGCEYLKTLEKFSVPASITKLTIGMKVFKESGLNEFKFADKAEITELNIGESAFQGCKNLTKFKVPASVKKLNIGKDAFSSLIYGLFKNLIKESGLNEFKFADKAEITELNIGESAFRGCSRLESFSVPASVRKLNIGAGAFSSLYVHKKVKKESGLNKFEIPAGAKVDELNIVKGSFWGCKIPNTEEGSGLNVPGYVKERANTVKAFEEPD